MHLKTDLINSKTELYGEVLKRVRNTIMHVNIIIINKLK